VGIVESSAERAALLGDKPSGKEEVIFRRFWDKGSGSEPELSIDSPWLRIVASDELLGIVNAYRDTKTRIFYVPATPPTRVEVTVSPTFSPYEFGGGDRRQLGAQVAYSFAAKRGQ